MTPHLPRLRKALRSISLFLIPPFLILILISVLVTQFTELGTAKEILSLSSFITLLSFSALTFNWCRVSPSLTPEALLGSVYQSGIDLFLASLLALVATFFAWVQINPQGLPTGFQPILFFMHWIFLAFSLLLFLLSILQLFATVRQIDR